MTYTYEDRGYKFPYHDRKARLVVLNGPALMGVYDDESAQVLGVSINRCFDDEMGSGYPFTHARKVARVTPGGLYYADLELNQPNKYARTSRVSTNYVWIPPLSPDDDENPPLVETLSLLPGGASQRDALFFALKALAARFGTAGTAMLRDVIDPGHLQAIEYDILTTRHGAGLGVDYSRTTMEPSPVVRTYQRFEGADDFPAYSPSITYFT